MILSVTALGARDGDAVGAVARVVDYLDGRCPAAAGRSPSWWNEKGLKAASIDDAGPVPEASAGPLAYYADSVEGPGTWLGRGLASDALVGEVDRDQLQRMLLGQDPATGHQLVDGRGSALRAEQLGRQGVEVSPTGEPDELLTLPQAASLLGVSSRYLRRLTRATAEARAAKPTPQGAQPDPLDHPYLDAIQNGPQGHWRVTRAEVARFAAERTPPAAVIGYDLTFSVPKSVSILWARSDAVRQAEILDAVQSAVRAGVAYLEDNAAFVRVGSSATVEPARGLVAASYAHGTSRALDPQLHCHVVVANMAEGPDATVRALDGRALYVHAKTASYLAAAELRTQLSRRLGVEWGEVERGLADVAGVPRAAIVEMSKRARELEAVLPQLEAFYTRGNAMRARGRQMAAYITRAAKDERGVDPDALRPWWATQLDGVGFTERTLRRCYGRRAAVPLVTGEDRDKLFSLLDSPRGVTEMAATFTRRDVLQRVADWSGDRLGAAEVCDLADVWLVTEGVVRLDAPRRDGRAGDVIRLRSGRTVSAVGDEALYTTQEVDTQSDGYGCATSAVRTYQKAPPTRCAPRRRYRSAARTRLREPAFGGTRRGRREHR